MQLLSATRAQKSMPDSFAQLCKACRAISISAYQKQEPFPFDQTMADLRSSAESMSCELCCVRWKQLSEEERCIDWNMLGFMFFGDNFEEPVRLYFNYRKSNGSKALSCCHLALAIPAPEPETPSNYREGGAASCIPRMECFQPQIMENVSPGLHMAYALYIQCINSHASCLRQAVTEYPLPTRLIHLGEGDDLSPVLVSTKQLATTTVYMTLSHCWGDQKYTCLTRGNIKEMKKGIFDSAISKTFKEAMMITKSFGVKYLWIDSLCIIQTDLEDWRVESLKMADVYRGAICNLAATAATDGRGGCLSTRSSLTLTPCKITIPRSINSSESWTVYIVDEGLYMSRVNDSPLGKRAWVIQERYLAQRMVHFAYDQIFWECQEVKACDIFPQSLPQVIQTTTTAQLIDVTDGCQLERSWNRPDISRNQALSIWDVFVTEYTSTNLTAETDKLVAIAGLAKCLAPVMNCRYLWEADLTMQLLWSVSDNEYNVRPKVYIAPTWSWASLVGKVQPRYRSLDKWKDKSRTLVDIVGVEVIGESNEPMGQIKSGTITMTGLLAMGEISRASVITDASIDLRPQQAHVGPHYAVDFVPDLKCAFDEQAVYCMPIIERYENQHGASVLGLVLVAEKRDNYFYFKRIGIFRVVEMEMAESESNVFWKRFTGVLDNEGGIKGRTRMEMNRNEDDLLRNVIRIE